jgi:hypothetical protein
MNLGLIIYLISILRGLNTIIIFGISIGLTSIIIFSIGYIVSLDENDEMLMKKSIKMIKFFTIMFTTSLIFNIFIPTQRDAYEILIASQVTEGNYNLVKEEIKGAVDFLVERLK